MRDRPRDKLLRENREWLTRAKDFRLARIRKVAAQEPDLPLELLAERFNETVDIMRYILGPHATQNQREVIQRRDVQRMRVPGPPANPEARCG